MVDNTSSHIHALWQQMFDIGKTTLILIFKDVLQMRRLMIHNKATMVILLRVLRDSEH